MNSPLPRADAGPTEFRSDTLEPGVPGARRRARGVLTATALFLVLVCVALLALNVLLASRARDSELRQADVAAANLARAMSERTNAMVSEVEHVLSSIVYELERQDVTQDTLQGLQPLLVTQAANVKQLYHFFVYGSHGELLSSSQPMVEARREPATRASSWRIAAVPVNACGSARPSRCGPAGRGWSRSRADSTMPRESSPGSSSERSWSTMCCG